MPAWRVRAPIRAGNGRAAENRMVAFPYTKRLCAIMDVDQSAAVVLMSLRTANRLGVAENKRVFVHGTADVHEFPIRTCERGALDRSIAIGHLGRDVFSSANVAVSRIRFFEVYSCFPSAVQIACKELGIPSQISGYDLTCLGGLPFHGGPGNNYALHGIVAMIGVLRRHPSEFGLVTANGGHVPLRNEFGVALRRCNRNRSARVRRYLTEHSAAVYSAVPYETTHVHALRWKRLPMADAQRRVAEEGVAARVQLAEQPDGTGVIELYTLEHVSERQRAILLGRVLSGAHSGQRFLAISTDAKLIAHLSMHEGAGITGALRTTHDGRTYFDALALPPQQSAL